MSECVRENIWNMCVRVAMQVGNNRLLGYAFSLLVV